MLASNQPVLVGHQTSTVYTAYPAPPGQQAPQYYSQQSGPGYGNQQPHGNQQPYGNQPGAGPYRSNNQQQYVVNNQQPQYYHQQSHPPPNYRQQTSTTNIGGDATGIYNRQQTWSSGPGAAQQPGVQHQVQGRPVQQNLQVGPGGSSVAEGQPVVLGPQEEGQGGGRTSAPPGSAATPGGGSASPPGGGAAAGPGVAPQPLVPVAGSSNSGGGEVGVVSRRFLIFSRH